MSRLVAVDGLQLAAVCLRKDRILDQLATDALGLSTRPGHFLSGFLAQNIEALCIK